MTTQMWIAGRNNTGASAEREHALLSESACAAVWAAPTLPEDFIDPLLTNVRLSKTRRKKWEQYQISSNVDRR